MPLDEITEELIADVTTTLRSFLTEGFKKYPEQRWLGQSTNVHLKHALAHVAYLWDDDDTSIRPENDYANALMRIAMAHYVKTHLISKRLGIGPYIPAGWGESGPPIRFSPNWLSKEKP